MKFNYGSLRNNKGVEAPIVIDSPVLERGDIIAGGALLLIGFAYAVLGISSLTSGSFRNGVAAHEQAEYKTMVDLNIIEED